MGRRIGETEDNTPSSSGRHADNQYNPRGNSTRESRTGGRSTGRGMDRNEIHLNSSGGEGNFTARIFDAQTGECVRELRGHTGVINSALFSHDGTRIVTASADYTARIWNAHTGECILILRGHTGIVNSAEFNPTDTRIVTASNDGSARLWNAETGECIREFIA